MAYADPDVLGIVVDLTEQTWPRQEDGTIKAEYQSMFDNYVSALTTFGASFIALNRYNNLVVSVYNGKSGYASLIFHTQLLLWSFFRNDVFRSRLGVPNVLGREMVDTVKAGIQRFVKLSEPTKAGEVVLAFHNSQAFFHGLFADHKGTLATTLSRLLCCRYWFCFHCDLFIISFLRCPQMLPSDPRCQ